MVKIDRVVEALLQEHDKRVRFHSIRDVFPFESIDVSYTIQDELVQRLRLLRATHPVGYKIGLTSPRMQAMCGIPHPIAGRVLADVVYPNHSTLSLSHYMRLGIECELAVRIGKDVNATSLPSTINELGQAVEAVAPAFELVEDRQADYASLDMLSLVADNSWNAGIVLGTFQSSWPDLASLEGTVEVNGRTVDHGFGRDVMGHPFQPLLWLATHLAGRGAGLRAGDVVMTGSIVPTRFPSTGDRYRFSLGTLGAVDIVVEV